MTQSYCDTLTEEQHEKIVFTENLEVLPPDLAELYRVRGSSYNQTSSKIEQLALAEFIRDGHIEKTIRRLRKIYAEKSELLLSLLNEYFGETAGIRLAETALCTELSVNCDKSASELALVAIAGGVRVIPTKSADGTAKLRLSFAGIPAEKMRKGVELLRELISPYCRSRT